MKTILFVIVILSLFAMAPGCPGGVCPTQPPPEKTKPPTEPPPPPPPPTEPPEITEPPGTEPPEVTEPPGTEPPEVTEPPESSEPTESGRPGIPETKGTPKPGGEKDEPHVIKLPSSGYGPPPAQPMSAGTIARWGLLFLIGLGGIFLAAWSLKG